MDKNLSKFVKFVISENIALAVMSYFEQVFAFCMLITKHLLQWFLLIMFKEHTLRRSTNLFSRNHPTLFCFVFVFFLLIRESSQMPKTEVTLSN